MKQIFGRGLWFRCCLEIQRNKINLFSITLELFVEIDISEELFLFFRAYTEKGVKVRLLILVYESQSTFHSWRENMEQLLTSVTLWVLAPLPGRKENTCRVCLYALAGSVTLSFGFFSIFAFCNANRADLPITICLQLLPSSEQEMQGQRRGDTLMYLSEQVEAAAHRPPEFRNCHARISS